MGSLTVNDLPEDFSQEEKTALITYIDNGVPGLASVQDSEMAQWFIMYMAGKTYAEIAIAFKVDKEKVLFVANKMKWLDRKMSHVNDILLHIEEKVKTTKLESANTMATIISSFNKYYNDHFTRYLKTGDKTLIEGMNTKVLGQYQKAIETLEKIMSDSVKKDINGKSQTPLVNINMNSGTLAEGQDGSLNITDSKTDLGTILKLMAEAKKSSKEEKDE
jgi:hypothetical protein